MKKITTTVRRNCIKSDVPNSNPRDQDLQKQDCRHAEDEIPVFCFVMADPHSRNGTDAAADCRSGKKSFLRDSPLHRPCRFGFPSPLCPLDLSVIDCPLLIHRKEQKCNQIDHSEIDVKISDHSLLLLPAEVFWHHGETGTDSADLSRICSG